MCVCMCVYVCTQDKGSCNRVSQPLVVDDVDDVVVVLVVDVVMTGSGGWLHHGF